MSESPFFQFYPSDWLAGTRGLTAAETGVYITIVAMMYEAEGPVQADFKRLARLCGSTPAAFKKAISGLLSTGKLTQDDRGFFNRRVEIEIEKRSEKRASASTSANARWNKNKQNQTPTNANASVSQCDRNANQKPDTREEDIPTTSADADAPPIKVVDVDPVNKLVWDMGLKLLAPSGAEAAVKAARPKVGKWLKGRSSIDVLSAIRQAEKAGTQDPFPFVEAILKGAAGGGKHTPAGWVDPVNGRGVEQFHPHAIDMGGGWWTTKGDCHEYFKNDMLNPRPDKWTRDRQDAEVREALQGCI